MSFETTVSAGLRVLQYRPWAPGGEMNHGFVGIFDDAAALEREALPGVVRAKLNINSLCVVTQTHGTEIFAVEALPPPRGFFELGEADGIVAPRSPVLHGLALAIVTADCLPMIFRSPGWLAVVHAGWRGLSAGIISALFSRVPELRSENLQVCIGPCAGRDRYEVGPEVVGAFADRAVVRSRNDGSGCAYLDLVATARAEVLRESPQASVVASEICTISDRRFYSYRREGDTAKRNVTFAVIEG